jgi:hypothetical protein
LTIDGIVYVIDPGFAKQVGGALNISISSLCSAACLKVRLWHRPDPVHHVAMYRKCTTLASVWSPCLCPPSPGPLLIKELGVQGAHDQVQLVATCQLVCSQRIAVLQRSCATGTVELRTS